MEILCPFNCNAPPLTLFVVTLKNTILFNSISSVSQVKEMFSIECPFPSIVIFLFIMIFPYLSFLKFLSKDKIFPSFVFLINVFKSSIVPTFSVCV